ncbi:PDZ domain-containing protein [Elizabethkingia anophelis]|uniref:Protease n=1 Tax=Elizabethkingia anophelis R26 TaxID=1246994 RepID=A0ABN5BV96_9FLAO|nr:S41 family peptidase [Elizabethkingia anophelis]ATC36951.1 protease [Elizabethkingia anophelis R26]ATC40629.1 protease [Elizabethkingia anophelis Ag1]ATC44308.1 protease [Elizabethkingia anophelis]ATC47984.1 protease [Elizabethkingia anophelis]ELR80055.1 periplasmic protease [Elizabethkingia anophelis R26]
MKNLNKLSLVSIIGLLSFTSCSRDTINTDNNGGGTNTVAVKAENDFVWKGLNSWYYWQKNDNKPNYLDDNFKNSTEYANYLNSRSTDKLFYDLLYKYTVIDRFSWIENNGVIQEKALVSLNAANKSSGLNYSIFTTDNAGSLIGLVNYVVPGSPADQQGIKRGDAITKIGGVKLNTSNYAGLQNDSYTITIEKATRDDKDLIVLSNARDVTLSKVDMNENPVIPYKLFKMNGKNIAYLVYNGFKADYNGELNDEFAKMKQDNVTELILDLRYNGGGSVETAVALGEMITGQTNKPYVTLKFNDKHTKENETKVMKNTVPLYAKGDTRTPINAGIPVNILGTITKLYVLTTKGTASASELTIDALRPYIDVFTIGETTYGKFVGSITLYDSPNDDYISYNNRNKSHSWTMQPIVFAYWNSRNDQHPVNGTGLPPNYSMNAGTYFGRIKEFGDTSDPALAKALEQITGQQPVAKAMLSASIGKVSLKLPAEAGMTFIGSNKTLTPYGTDVYINNFKQK